jgi:hypothetical protein
MEWTCARCGQIAAADDPSWLASMGWQLSQEDGPLCVLCVKRPAVRFDRSLLVPVPRTGRSDTGGSA